MNKVNSILLLKIVNKNLAIKIKTTKKLLKERARDHLQVWEQQWALSKLKSEYRHNHIAYCLMRGTPYELIESNCGPDNRPNLKLIEEVRLVYSEATEDVCASA